MIDELIDLLSSDRFLRVDASCRRSITQYFSETFSKELNVSARKHPLGFIYMEKYLNAGHSLRYHFWPSDWQMPNAERGNELHDHSYRLDSLIVFGEMKHQTFSLQDDESSPWEVAEVSYTGSKSVLSRTGKKVKLADETANVFSQGERYSLLPGTLHKATPITLPLATIVLKREEGATAPIRVIVGSAMPEASQFERRKLSPSEISTLRTELKALV